MEILRTVGGQTIRNIVRVTELFRCSTNIIQGTDKRWENAESDKISPTFPILEDFKCFPLHLAVFVKNYLPRENKSSRGRERKRKIMHGEKILQVQMRDEYQKMGLRLRVMGTVPALNWLRNTLCRHKSLLGLISLYHWMSCVKSYGDGSNFELTPESAVQAQKVIGADIIIPLDELPPYHIS